MRTMPTSINGGVDQLSAAQPVQQMLDRTRNYLGPLDGRPDHGLTSADALVGQATGLAKSGALSTVTGALPVSSLLGGLPLNGLPLGG